MIIYVRKAVVLLLVSFTLFAHGQAYSKTETEKVLDDYAAKWVDVSFIHEIRTVKKPTGTSTTWYYLTVFFKEPVTFKATDTPFLQLHFFPNTDKNEKTSERNIVIPTGDNKESSVSTPQTKASQVMEIKYCDRIVAASAAPSVDTASATDEAKTQGSEVSSNILPSYEFKFDVARLDVGENQFIEETTKPMDGLMCFFNMDEHPSCSGDKTNCIEMNKTLERAFDHVRIFIPAESVTPVDSRYRSTDPADNKDIIFSKVSLEPSPVVDFTFNKLGVAALDDSEEKSQGDDSAKMGQFIEYGGEFILKSKSARKRSVDKILSNDETLSEEDLKKFSNPVCKFNDKYSGTPKELNKLACEELKESLMTAGYATINNLKNLGKALPIRRERQIKMISSGKISNEKDLALEEVMGGITIYAVNYHYIRTPKNNMIPEKSTEWGVRFDAKFSDGAENRDFTAALDYTRYFKELPFILKSGVETTPTYMGFSLEFISPGKRQDPAKEDDKTVRFVARAGKSFIFSDDLGVEFEGMGFMDPDGINGNNDNKFSHSLSVSYFHPATRREGNIDYYFELVLDENGLTSEHSKNLIAGVDFKNVFDKHRKKVLEQAGIAK